MLKLYVRNIKKGFATNSSSYHSTLILTEDEFIKWKTGEIEEIDGVKYKYFDDDDYEFEEETSGYRYYIESQSERVINTEKVIAITYCETTEM